MVMTMIGASMLWVGWFGFNVGSNLEANGGATLAMINTFIATAAATLAWSAHRRPAARQGLDAGRGLGHGGGPRRRHPGLRHHRPDGRDPAGRHRSAVCYVFVTVVKGKLGYDDSLDVFGIHGVGGIIGAVLTGVFSAGGLGRGQGRRLRHGAQLWVQIEGVIITILWSGVVSAVAFKLVDLTVGLRVDTDTERQGLDLTSHGEQAYHS
jgi:Amt family ammonium transporter